MKKMNWFARGQPVGHPGLFLWVTLPVTLLLAGPVTAQTAAHRSIDGSGNNEAHPRWGSAGIKLLRVTTPEYADGRSAPAGPNRPGPREISNSCADQESMIGNEKGLSDFFWVWGQFLDHDISLTTTAEPLEPMDIAVPAGDPFFDPEWTGEALIPFFRSSHRGRSVREQVNDITAWIDASHIYGSDLERAQALRRRRGRGDRLKTSKGRLLPFNSDGLPNAPTDHDPSFFLAGDIRANENVALTALHTLFVREHNRLVGVLRGEPGLSMEDRYLLARELVGAEIQAITYREFLPLLLGEDALAAYSGYNPRTNPGIANMFSTACYRFGHSMLPRRLMRLRRNGRPIKAGHLSLREAFFAPGELRQHGIESVLRGLAKHRAQEVDLYVVDDVRNFLFGRPGQGGFDLASLNIQRGRDHGLASYNQAREDLGLGRKANFTEISSVPEIQRELAAIYHTIDDVDVWVGALAENHMPGSMLGELSFHIVRDQFERLRDGDRFWYENALPESLVSLVDELSLAEIIRLNTKIGSELPDDLFHAQ